MALNKTSTRNLFYDPPARPVHVITLQDMFACSLGADDSSLRRLTMTSPYGPRDIRVGSSVHRGVDFALVGESQLGTIPLESVSVEDAIKVRVLRHLLKRKACEGWLLRQGSTLVTVKTRITTSYNTGVFIAIPELSLSLAFLHLTFTKRDGGRSISVSLDYPGTSATGPHVHCQCKVEDQEKRWNTFKWGLASPVFTGDSNKLYIPEDQYVAE